MQHPQEREQTEWRRRARDKRGGKKNVWRDEVRQEGLCRVEAGSEWLEKVNEGQTVTLQTDFKQPERKQTDSRVVRGKINRNKGRG